MGLTDSPYLQEDSAAELWVLLLSSKTKKIITQYFILLE
jgi:hypothetical protein